MCVQKWATHRPANSPILVVRGSAQCVRTRLMARCPRPQIQDVHVQNTAVKLPPSRQKGSSLSMEEFVSSRQKPISCRARLKDFFFFFWWVCNQFSSFRLGWDRNPSSFNTFVNLQESCMGSTSAGHPNQLLTRPLLCLASHAAQRVDYNSADDFCLGPLSAVSMSGQTAMTGFVRRPCSVPTGMCSSLIALNTTT